MKVNEFVNNNNNLKEEFDKLKQDLIYEVAHLSDPLQKTKSRSFNEILSYGYNILPLIMQEIKSGDNLCEYTLCLIVINLIEDNSIQIDKSDHGDVSKMRIKLINWWDKNRLEYE